MLGPLAEAGEEFDRQEVQKALDEAMDAVLGAAEPARPMVDDQFADPKAAGVGQHRNEAMQFAVDLDFAEDLGAIALHAAIVVVQPDAGQATDEVVENPTGPNLVPRIVPLPLPTADDFDSFFEFRQEARNLGGVVLQVGIEREENRAARRPRPGRQGGRFAEVAAEAHAMHRRVFLRHVLDLLP